MAKGGKCDFKQFKALQEKFEKLERNDFDKFCQDCAKELAARLLAKVIKKTPVGKYEAGSGKTGGTLRRGWTVKTENEANVGGTSNGAAYAKSLPVSKNGDVFEIEIINPVHYASYVEFGHRTADLKKWVNGYKMLTLSAEEVEKLSPKLLESKVKKYLEGCFNDSN